MKLFIFGKEAHQIKAKARAEGWNDCEEHYLAEQKRKQKEYADDKESLIKQHKRELKDKEIYLMNMYDAEIKKLRAEVARKDAQVKNAQQAWELFSGVLPEIKNCTSLLKLRAKAVHLERTKDLQFAEEQDDFIDRTIRKLGTITPDMNKLLSYDDTSVGTMK